MTVKDVIEYPLVITGGGAPEALASHKIRDWAGSLSGRAQLAAEKYADALEAIPLVFASMDPLHTQVQIRSKSTDTKAKYGIDVLSAKIADLSAKDIYDPLAVKEQVINSATEAACMILRIDDVIAAGKSRTLSGPPPDDGGYGGGMGDMDM
jgi:archaeal chaperonin